MRKLSRAVLLPVLVATSLFAAPEPPFEIRFEERPAPLDTKPDPAELTAVPELSEPLAAQALTGASSSLFVPIVLSSAGVPPSFFTSELTLTNRGGRALGALNRPPDLRDPDRPRILVAHDHLARALNMPEVLG